MEESQEIDAINALLGGLHVADGEHADDTVQKADGPVMSAPSSGALIWERPQFGARPPRIRRHTATRPEFV